MDFFKAVAALAVLAVSLAANTVPLVFYVYGIFAFRAFINQ